MQPNEITTLTDPQSRITFRVVAYRKLSDSEMIQQWYLFRQTKQGRKVKRNSTYTLMTIIGHDGR